MADEFDGLYAPIVGSSETQTSHRPVDTPAATLARTNRLRREYDELREEMVQELGAVEVRMTQPAENGKNYILPMKKTIKKRNDKKVSTATPLTIRSVTNLHSLQSDFERHKGKVDSLMAKGKRSDRDNANLAKANADFAAAKEVRRPSIYTLEHILTVI
jgi:hypothetical protein